MKPEISIVCPAIRVDNWDAVYRSILSSFSRSFELIIVSPYTLTPFLQGQKNVKYVKDFGSPVRCSDIGASLAEADLITWTADDALFLPGALEKNIDLFRSMGGDEKNVLIAKYYEGKGWEVEKPLQPDEYFMIKGSTWTQSKYLPESYYLFNVGIMYRSWFERLGGWSCEFEGTFYSHADLAIRSQFSGSRVLMSPHPMLNCDHNQIDHGPIEEAQVHFDKKCYFEKYHDPSWMMRGQEIPFHHWKGSPAVWERRFK